MIPEIIPEQFSHGVNTIPTLDPSVTLSAQDEYRKRLHESYQTWKLKGFTISQMTDYGCWDKPEAKPNNLYTTTPIHPLYQPHLWMNELGLLGMGMREMGDEESNCEEDVGALFEVGESVVAEGEHDTFVM
jgi:hypothetical protein